MPKTVILGAARTPFGKMGGALAPLDATELGGTAITAALERAEVAPDQIQHVVFGQVLQAGQGQIPSRQAQIKGGIPKEVSSETVNKVCASGLRSAGIVDQAVRAGDLDVAVAGGHGVDVERSLPAEAGALRFPHGRRQGARRHGPRRAYQPVHRQAHGRGGGRGRRRARDHARRHGQVRAALARAGHPGHRRGPPARGDHAGHDQLEEGRHDGRGRRGPSPRDQPGVAVEAARRVPQGRRAHGRKRTGRERRRRRAGAVVGRVGEERTAERRSPRSSLRRRLRTTSPTSRVRPPTPRPRRSSRPGCRSTTSTCSRSTRRSPRWRSTRCACSAWTSPR